MAKRAGAYQVPFEVDELGYDEAVAVAADTGSIPGTTGPLLETVVDMLDACGRPDEYYDCLQVAGTNGKTSTSRFTAAILRAEGLRCALYTSPHLVRYEERMEIDGAPVASARFAHGVSAAVEASRRVNARRSAAGEDPYTITPFDLLTVAALILYAEEGVDAAVLEVGLGGRWDATSATDPVAVAITGIGLDHTHILGDTLAKIASEKAAVIKPGRAVVLGEGTNEPSVRRVMDERCWECRVEPFRASHELHARPSRAGEPVVFSVRAPYGGAYELGMVKPSYQMENAACAVALAEAYLARPLRTAGLAAALDACPTPGRFDVLRREPLLLIDACHNPQSCEHFVASMDELWPGVASRPTLLIAVLSDKDAAGIVRALVPAFPRIAVTQTASARALSSGELCALVDAELERAGRPRTDVTGVYRTVASALEALTAAGEAVVAAGTITLAGEVAGIVRGASAGYEITSV